MATFPDSHASGAAVPSISDEAQWESIQASLDGQFDEAKANELAELVDRADVDYLAREIPSAIGESLEGIARVTEIVRAMRQFTHPGTGESKAVDVNEAARSTVTVARNEWGYVADLEFDLDDNLAVVTCHPGDLNQVILNLIVNAAQAIAEKLGRQVKSHGDNEGVSEKGKIVVGTTARDGVVEIRVSDTGIGIPEAIRDQVFDPFFTPKEVGKGTGQGLAVSHAAVERQGGSLSFETEEGVGTTFIIRLPLS